MAKKARKECANEEDIQKACENCSGDCNQAKKER